MITLWVGDFRARQLQSTYIPSADYHFLIDDFAEYSWFANNIVTQLPKLSLEQANVVILLGFNDSVYSCVQSSFNIARTAKQYAEIINSLVADYPNLNFYVCSVGPINSDYPFITATSNTISKEILTEKIRLFNQTIKENCTATYIDSYTYLTSINFETSDGVRYTNSTYTLLHSYISNNITGNVSAYFLPRVEKPDAGVDSYTYWMSGGENPYSEGTNTSYAWGRFYEITGESPKLSETSNWYSSIVDEYQTGAIPKTGAIACWANGFVAIVEQVNVDGSIVTSECTSTVADDTWASWQLIDRTNTDGAWGMGPSYAFQGFIYSSIITEELSTSNQPKITGFTITECLPTRAKASFITSGISEMRYSLLQNGRTIRSDTIIVKPDFNTIQFENLRPVTDYTVKLKTTVADGANITSEVSFKTPQDYPASVSNIILTATNNTFTLTATRPNYLSYSGSNSGYDIQLIVNTKIVKTISEDNATKDLFLTNFTLKNKFNYTSKAGDNIQIGVRTWVKNNAGTKIYDSQNVKTSNSICLLKNPIIVHLNK